MCDDPRRKSGTRKIAKTIFLKFTPLPFEWGFFISHGHYTNCLSGFLNFPKVSTDTRKDVTNSIFIALSGENFDGNVFAEKALESGAKYAVIDNPDLQKVSGTCLLGIPWLLCRKWPGCIVPETLFL